MQLSLVITLTCAAAGLVCGAPFAHNENNNLRDGNDQSQQSGINAHVYHKLGGIVALFDVTPNDNGGMDSGNNGDSNGDDGSHKPPSQKSSLTKNQSHLLQLHHSKSTFSELYDFTWNQKAADLAQIRVAKCTTDVLHDKQNYIERLAIGHTSWNEVLSDWWGKNEERNNYLKKTLDQSMKKRKSVSIGCAMQKCPHGPYYACNYILSSNDHDGKY